MYICSKEENMNLQYYALVIINPSLSFKWKTKKVIFFY